MKFRLLLISAFFVCFFYPAPGETRKDSVRINFRQSKVNVDTNYMDNRRALEHAGQTIAGYENPDSNLILLNVRVVGGASPEGSVRFNEWLSRQRALRIFDYFNKNINIPDSLMSQTFLGRDWEGLRAIVAEDSGVPDRDEVISTLDEIIANIRDGEKDGSGNLLRLKRIGGGVPYLYLYRHIFPTLRESKIVLTFGTPESEEFKIIDMPLSISTLAEIETVLSIPMPEPRQKKPFYMALKSNMILDALSVPEIGVEFYLGKNFSIVGNWMYGWWDKDRTHKYWRLYGGDLAFRWWFGRAAHQKPLTGHHIGIYGGLLTYDFEFGGKGYMGGLPGRNLWVRSNRHFGIEYGYSLPVARRFNIDFTLGLGYLGGKYIVYEPSGRCYVWEATKKRTWIGPTKLEVSLVWLLGRGNFNVKKGGRK